jgi:hypothetical protein
MSAAIAPTRRAATADLIHGFLRRTGRPATVEGLLRRERVLRGTGANVTRAAIDDLCRAGVAAHVEVDGELCLVEVAR